MADSSVYITGITDDAFANEIRKLPPWATEQTAGKIAGYLQKSLGLQAQTLEGLKQLSNSGKGGRLGTDEIKRVNDELDKLGKHLKVRNADDAVNARKKTKEIEKTSINGEKLNKVLGLMAGIGAKVFNAESKYLEVYDSLYTSGINLLNGNNSTRDGFEALNQMVIQTGMRLETLQKIIEKYSQSVNVVGAAKFTKALSTAMPHLNKLGFYGEQAGDMVGTLIDSEMGYMDIRSKSADAIASDSVKLALQLTRLSKTVGLSEQQVRDSMKETAKSDNAMLIASKYGTDAAKNFSAAAAGVKDAGLKEMLTELAGAANPAQVKGYMDLVKAGMGDYAEQLNQQAKSMLHVSPEVAAKQMDKLGEQFRNASGRLAALAPVWDSVGKPAAALVNAVMQASAATSTATETQIDNAQKTQASLAGLNTQLERMKAIPEAVFFPMVAQVNSVTSALKRFNNAVYDAIGSVKAETRSNIGMFAIIGGAIAGFVLAIRMGTSKVSSIVDLFRSSGNTLATTTKSTSGALNTFGSKLGTVAKGLAMIAAPAVIDSALGAAGIAGGKAIDTDQDRANWERASLWEKTQSGTARLIEQAGKLVGLGNIVNEAQSDRIASETAYLNKKNGISAPARSTVDSPSAVPAKPVASANTESTSSDVVPAASIEKPSADAEVNSLLAYQAKIMVQLLESSNSLLRVNNDILKYTRSRA